MLREGESAFLISALGKSPAGLSNRMVSLIVVS
jgi:hypothetical protein